MHAGQFKEPEPPPANFMDRFAYTVLESDDSDVEEAPDVVRHKTKIIYQNTFPYIHMEPPDVLYERWTKIKPEVKRAFGHMLHVSVFWWHILFRQQENHSTTAWAVDMGFLDSNISNDLSLKRLSRIEILELVLNTMEKCLADKDPERKARDLVSLSTSFKMQEDCLAQAVSYLEEAGPSGLSRKLLELGRKELRYQLLRVIFSEYAHYVQVMSCSKKKMMRELTVDPEPWSLQKSEEMKNKGNEQFQKKKYDLAVKWYTKAIRYHTNNHLLYGNRALAYIRCEKYLKAMGDGKRAIVLQQDWAKGHYRFCDALFFLGARDKALQANLTAQRYCSADPEGMRDLLQQHQRFMAEFTECRAEGKPKKTEAKKGSSKRPEGACGIDSVSQQDTPEEAPGICPVENTEPEERKEELETGKHRTGPETEDHFKSFKDIRSEMAARRTKKAAPSTPEKQPVKSKHLPPKDKPPSGGSSSSSGLSSKDLCAAVLDAYTALSDQRCRNAQQAFCLALTILDSTGIKDLGISDLDRALLVYGYATALLETGQPEELGEALRQFQKLSSSVDRKFQSLVLYGMGKVFLKENRFAKALENFSNALLMVQRQITCGKLTWPTTKVTVEETCPEYLTDLLETSIEMCKFPPKPDAVCRHQHCLSHAVQIYFTDPDFKGFIRMSCCQRCKVEFHITCWKKYKAAAFSDKNDKDFLQDSCFTPDCTGRICHIIIFGSTGLVKCEFEAPILKSKAPVKLKVKQTCTSLKKSKEDAKLRRKQQRATASFNEDETITVEEDTSNREAAKASPKDCIVYADRVLHQIYESRELFKDDLQSISSMMVCLRPWMELDEVKGHTSVLKAEPQALWELVDILLERRNRVWARVFVQVLSGCQNIKPKLHDWAQQLDSAGLKAAEKFIGQCGDRLEELDLSSLLAFPPLQDVLIEKFGTMPELFDNTGFTVIEYLKQAPPQEMRLFVWTLEENRERYPSCFTMLDEYFEMDAICLVIKKSGIDHVSLVHKAKSKNRKKKQKEQKSVIILSGIRSDFVRDQEDEDIFSEEDSLMLFDVGDPFSVPDHLRDQVAEFEGQYVSSGHLNYYKRCLDNNPDPTKESLYDYFEQILEEHGPLSPSDPLLVGELENFPPEAQRNISAAGGLEPFLRDSLRFYMMDNLIGLMAHAVSLQLPEPDDASVFFKSPSNTYGAGDSGPMGPSHLNPAAKEFLPQSEYLNMSENNVPYDSAILTGEDILGLALCEPQNSQPGTSPSLSDPYDFGSQITSNFNYMFVEQDMDMSETSKPELQEIDCPDYLLSSSLKDFIFNPPSPSPENSINSYSERGVGEHCSAVIYKEANTTPECVTVSVQTLGDAKDARHDVAVNTEPYLLFEKNKGDMTQKEKNNIKFEKQIQKMLESYEYLQSERKDQVSVLEAEVEDNHQKAEITSKELSLFQHKLEEEIRKDQQEKRDNQETLKALKGEIKELQDSQERMSKRIQDKNLEYQTELDCFLAISNQCEAEKMSLEEEIRRCGDRCAKAVGRSRAAQLCILQNRRERSLRGLKKCLSDGRVILLNMTELSSRYPSASLHATIEAWKTCVKEAENKIARTEAQYDEQTELVSTGTVLGTLAPISAPSPPAPPPVPALMSLSANQQLVPQQFPARHAFPHALYAVQPPLAPPAASAPQARPAERAADSPPGLQAEAAQRAAAPTPLQHLGVFEKIIDRLRSMFPHYNRAVLAKFIQEVRTANAGNLNLLTYEDVINRVAQLILDHQENTSEQTSVKNGAAPGPSPESCRTATPPPPTHVWKNVPSQHRNTSKALNMEDPCIICHEDMAPDDLCVLECRHSFHRECIRSWLREQSTCPTCREHALLPEDFPTLPGRPRKGHAPAASFS